MKSLNPAAFLRQRQKEEAVKKESAELLKERIAYAFKNKKDRAHFTESLKRHGVTATDFMKLACDVANDHRAAIRWARTNGKESSFKTLEDVTEKGSTLFRVMMVIREEYALEISKHISFDDAVDIAIEQVVLGR